jgi:nicotinamide mononucleotide (NMN) deamidase PncC
MACLQTGACRYEGQWLAVPEPATAGLLALGLAGILGAAVRRRSGFVPIGRRRTALVNG